jgi:hypothetical protein
MARRSTAAIVLLGATLACGPTIGDGDDVDEDLLSRGCERSADYFASQVLTYDPTYSGAPAPTSPNYSDPTAALGPPDYDHASEKGAVALGSGGLLELGFTGCELGLSGDRAPDLRVFEVGPFYERTFLSVRIVRASRDLVRDVVDVDADGYVRVGSAEGGVSDIDLDGRLPELAGLEGVAFDAVRILDDPAQGAWGPGEATGADIDAVEILTALP